MQFNVMKCKALHIGKKNIDYEYSMKRFVLESVEAEKDLGVMISHDLKTSNKCVRAYANANKILGMINRMIVNIHSEIMVKLYKSLVCSYMEYCTAAWSPYYVKDTELIEKIQYRFTKIITEVNHFLYTYRLLKLGPWTLGEHRN